jgi:hypothetical protein
MFLQYTEHLHMARLSTKHKITNYFWYVDDILIVFDPCHSSIQAILADFNTLHPNLQFTTETREQHNKLPWRHYPYDPLQLENSQTDWGFIARYIEHEHSFRNNSHTSKFAQHLVKQAHTFTTIHNTMQILHYQKKSAHLNTVERYYIHAEFTANNHLNYNQNIFLDPIFDNILKTHQQ